MSGVNKVILLGRIGKDPEVRVLEGNRKVARLSLATSEAYKDKTGQKVEQTEWHNIEFWGPQADVIDSYVKKGNMLYVEGKIRTRSYDGKDGQKKYVTDIVGQSLTLMSAAKQEAKPEPVAAGDVDDSDDLPF
jgi:single-strand DNA-binding protein